MGNKKTSSVASRAWRLLRFAFLWGRRDRTLKQRSLIRPRIIKRASYSYRLHYSEREFSFDDTPARHFKTHNRSASLGRLLPCITPTAASVADDDEFDEGRVLFHSCTEAEDSGDHDRADDDEDDEWGSHASCCTTSSSDVEEEEIDTKAEKFITDFYKQMRLQDLGHGDMLRS
ncbi:hypothetical protein HPP92_011583 [Vanilla planifolia]|uniref:Cotton fiber protein n=1 Tax=Vanilla planifolia TaxID=51239 RepID=A0A835R329_VANPL|nr:hypothetical protein HPP92_011583 [Vanilla planifolia]